jgi:hypothetical protein
MANEGGDAPFKGHLPGPKVFKDTHLIMAFDVDGAKAEDSAPSWSWTPEALEPVTTRRVGLFEGRDEFGCLRPLLGGEKRSNVVETWTWTDEAAETPGLNQIEAWEICNFSEDAASHSSSARVQSCHQASWRV